jgi:hypothetical protein
MERTRLGNARFKVSRLGARLHEQRGSEHGERPSVGATRRQGEAPYQQCDPSWY